MGSNHQAGSTATPETRDGDCVNDVLSNLWGRGPRGPGGGGRGAGARGGAGGRGGGRGPGERGTLPQRSMAVKMASVPSMCTPSMNVTRADFSLRWRCSDTSRSMSARTLWPRSPGGSGMRLMAAGQGLTLVQLSAQLEHFVRDLGCVQGLCNPW